MDDLEKLEKCKSISKEIILEFVKDNFGDKISIDDLSLMISNTKITINEELETDGQYNSLTRNIELKSINLDILIHEFAHKFSDVMSILSKNPMIEEGFATTFTNLAINHYINKYPEKSQEFINRMGNNKQYKLMDAYSIPVEMVNVTLETIRQRIGKDKEALYEYLFGDKKNYLNICKEALGNQYIDFYKKIKNEENYKPSKDQEINKKYSIELYEMILQKGDIEQQHILPNGEKNLYYIEIQKILKKQEIEKALQEQGLDIYDLKPGEFRQAINLIKQRIPNKLTVVSDDRIKIEDIFNCEKIKQEFFKNSVSIQELLEECKLNKDLINESDIYNILNTGKFSLKEVLTFKKELGIGSLDNKTLDYLASEYRRAENCSLENFKTLLKLLEDNNVKNNELIATINFLEMKEGKNLTGSSRTYLYLAKFNYLREEDVCGALKHYLSDDCTKYLGIGKKINEVLESQNVLNNEENRKEIVDILRDFEQNVDKQNVPELKLKCFEQMKNTYITKIKEDIKRYQEKNGFISDENFISDQIPRDGEIERKMFDSLGITELSQLETYEGSSLNFFNDYCIGNLIKSKGIIETLGPVDNKEKSAFLKLNIKNRETVFKHILSEMEGIEDFSDINKVSSFLNLINGEKISRDEKVDEQLKNMFEEKIKVMIQKRNTPIADLSKLYSSGNKVQDKIFAEEMKLLENIANQGEQDTISIGDIKELLINNAKKTEKTNEDIYAREVIQELLSKKYKQLNLTTNQFLDQMQSLTEIYPYLRSIGKENETVQIDALVTAARLKKQEIDLVNPQFLEYDNDIGKNLVVISNERNNFQVFSKDGLVFEDNDELINKLNRGKKGLFSIFKSKEKRELVENSIVLNDENGIKTLLNKYETGRLEIATYDNTRKKVIDKKEVESRDLGNNGGLVTTKESVCDKVTIFSKFIKNDNVRNSNGNNQRDNSKGLEEK